MRTNSSPISIMRRSCSDSPPTASQMDRVFGSDSVFEPHLEYRKLKEADPVQIERFRFVFDRYKICTRPAE
jgi:hypothetical protein